MPMRMDPLLKTGHGNRKEKVNQCFRMARHFILVWLLLRSNRIELRTGGDSSRWGSHQRMTRLGRSVFRSRKSEQPLVSMPISWKEVESAVSNSKPEALVFTPEEAVKRVSRVGDLFAPVLHEKQTLP
jgi:hypothetical protein